eukprot:gene2437-2770_t
MSSAGDRGAYEAGVVLGLVYSRPSEEVAWQFSTGISAGGSNAAMLSIKDEIYVDWEGGIVDGLLFKSGLYDSRPMYKHFVETIDVSAIQRSNRGLFFGATCLDDGLFTPFNKSYPDLSRAIYASSSIPGIFPPAGLKDGRTYVDGVLTYGTPILETARLCYETGATNVIIDVIIAIGSPNNQSNKDIETTFQAFPNVQLNIFYPSQQLPGNTLGFQYSSEMVNIGYKDAVNNENLVKLTKSDYDKMIKMGKTLYD